MIAEQVKKLWSKESSSDIENNIVIKVSYFRNKYLLIVICLLMNMKKPTWPYHFTFCSKNLMYWKSFPWITVWIINMFWGYNWPHGHLQGLDLFLKKKNPLWISCECCSFVQRPSEMYVCMLNNNKAATFYFIVFPCLKLKTTCFWPKAKIYGNSRSTRKYGNHFTLVVFLYKEEKQ